MGVGVVGLPQGLGLALLLFPVLIGGDDQQATFDVVNPLIFQAPASPGSHFGWSTALVNLNFGPQGKSSWIFIGDPKGNITRDPSYRNVREPGVVWRCSLYQQRRGGSEMLTPSCEALNIDPNRIGGCGDKCEGAPHQEYHTRNWVGGTMASSGTRLVISAHLWHRGSEKDPVVNGLAYWFDTEKMFTGTKQLNIGDRLTHRLIPFFYRPIPNVETLPYQFYTQPGGSGTLLPDLAHGEAGFSLHLTGDGQLLMGAPGVQVWRGAVVRYQDSSHDFRDTSRPNSYEGPEFNGYRIMKRNYGHGNEYFGYAVSSGKYFPRQWNQAEAFSSAGGSPRARGLTGEVVIFQIRDTGLEEQVVIVGDQFGSYFGSVLASADVNNDGLDELLIGAPLFNEPVTTASETFLDHGTVYMYSSALTGSGTLSSQNLIRITSGIGNKRGGRFGAAIVNLGDINEDDFNDIAIGAPFEDGQGAVYIFYGVEYLQTEWKPTLRVAASSALFTPLHLRGLGCSFSTPLDIDQNYTPDLAIGSFLSQSVMILRTRPMLDFETKVIYYAAGENSPSPIRQLGANARNFQIETCIRLKGKALEVTKTQLTLEVTLSIDAGQRVARFIFVEARERGQQKLTFELEASALGFACRKLLAQREENAALDENSPSIEPIHFEQWINYRGKSRDENSSLVYGIQSSTGQVEILGGKDVFEPMAPFPRVKRTIPEELNINSDCKDVSRCVPDLHIEAWWADDTDAGTRSHKITQVNLDWRRRLGIHVKLSNRGEPAYSPEVTFTFRNCNAPKHIDFQSQSTDCKSQSTGEREPKMRKDCTYVFVCSLGKALRSDEPREIVIPVSLRDIFAKAEMDEWVLGISVGVRNDPSSKRSHKDLTLSLVADVGVSLVGSVTSPKEPVSVHSPFNQQYEVILTGTSPVESLYFRFKFPASKSGEPLLALRRPTGNGIQCTGSFAELKEKGSLPTGGGSESMEGNVITSRRRRREASGTPGLKARLPVVARMLPTENMTLLGCGTWEDPSSAEACVEVKCNMYNILPNAQLELITFNMQFNASQAVVVVAEKRSLLLESLGSVAIFKESKNGHQGQTFSQTIVQFNEVSVAGKIPLWVYILSGLGGFLLLILIMFGLYKAGFFKRATKIELEERKAEVAEQEATRRASMLENPSQQELE